MHLSGEYRLSTPQDQVWTALQNPDVLAHCLPGCEQFNPAGNNEYDTTLKIGIAAVKGTYSAKIRLSEQEPPTKYRLSVSGKGTPGFINGSGLITLEPATDDPSNTIVRYNGDVEVGGPVASIGQRLLSGAARMLISQFWKCIEHELGPA
jgi:carbon monoxide dehydrogenase subunit G